MYSEHSLQNFECAAEKFADIERCFFASPSKHLWSNYEDDASQRARYRITLNIIFRRFITKGLMIIRGKLNVTYDRQMPDIYYNSGLEHNGALNSNRPLKSRANPGIRCDSKS